MTDRAGLRRNLLLPLATLIIYFGTRPIVSADAAALAIAGAVPAVYTIALVIWGRRIDVLATLFTLAFAGGCVAALLAGGNSLPLKLHDASVSFLLGIVLLVAGIIGRPLPVGRVLKVPQTGRPLDVLLGTMIGGFLILHALLHLVLALQMSTADYLVAGRIINIATMAVGGLALFAYVQRQRRAGIASAPTRSPVGGADRP